jgi:hypothetical protein
MHNQLTKSDLWTIGESLHSSGAGDAEIAIVLSHAQRLWEIFNSGVIDTDPEA